jgi:hypothetical protein
LEKVVFQQIEHFDIIGRMIRERNVKVWVNCSRRLFRAYVDLKELLKGEDRIDMTVCGTNWGMGCNSIHMLDIYAYLTEFKTYSYDNSGLLAGDFDSKRHGYKEFFGECVIKTDKGNITFICDCGDSAKLHIDIDSTHKTIRIDEAEKRLVISDKNDGSVTERDMDVSFTSDITNVIAQQIIDTGGCCLADFEETSFLHKIMIECFLNHMNKFTDTEVKICPIT